MTIRPITLRQAADFIRDHHRHHRPPQGHKFSIGLYDGDQMIGVAVVGRPVARALDDGWTAEITRLATDGTPNACSMLYGACRRAAIAMGYAKIITYTLATEPGTSLKASGFVSRGEIKGRPWNVPSRPREDKHPLSDKIRWEWPSTK